MRRRECKLPFDPHNIICEILGQPASGMTNPVNAEYECPFINSTCVKRSQRLAGPYPVCTVFRRDGTACEPIIICPKRFYEADLFGDVIRYCWPTVKPLRPAFVHEIRMGEVGNVDFVVADLAQDGKTINNFISVELQAIDITGTYEPAYSSIVLSRPLEERPTYNFNYANVRKRFITQLINKGFFHHHWHTKIVAVLQDRVYEYLKQAVKFSDTSIEESNILFMQYRLVQTNGNHTLVFKGISGTTHSALMMSSLYAQPPSKEEFCRHILAQIRRH